MNDVRKAVLDRLPEEKASAAFRQIREMAADPQVEISRFSPHVWSNDEALSIWNARLMNTVRKGRRLTGLPDLVRGMRKLPSGAKVEQISFSKGLKTGLVFFDAATQLPVGAVLSVRTEADVRRSLENWETAMGRRPTRNDADKPMAATSARREVKTKASIAALSR